MWSLTVHSSEVACVSGKEKRLTLVSDAWTRDGKADGPSDWVWVATLLFLFIVDACWLTTVFFHRFVRSDQLTRMRRICFLDSSARWSMEILCRGCCGGCSFSVAGSETDCTSSRFLWPSSSWTWHNNNNKSGFILHLSVIRITKRIGSQIIN